MEAAFECHAVARRMTGASTPCSISKQANRAIVGSARGDVSDRIEIRPVRCLQIDQSAPENN